MPDWKATGERWTLLIERVTKPMPDAMSKGRAASSVAGAVWMVTPRFAVADRDTDACVGFVGLWLRTVDTGTASAGYAVIDSFALPVSRRDAKAWLDSTPSTACF